MKLGLDTAELVEKLAPDPTGGQDLIPIHEDHFTAVRPADGARSRVWVENGAPMNHVDLLPGEAVVTRELGEEERALAGTIAQEAGWNGYDHALVEPDGWSVLAATGCTPCRTPKSCASL
jgi:hypothetical protein